MLNILDLFKSELVKDNMAREYINKRCISDKTIEENDLGYWPMCSGEDSKKFLVNRLNEIDRHLFIKNINGILFDRFPTSIAIPIFKNGNLHTFTFRSIDPFTCQKHFHLPGIDKHIFNERTINISKKEGIPLILCEGVFDALSLLELGYNALALLTAHANIDILSLMAGVKDILICLDYDVNDFGTGQKSAKIIAYELVKLGCKPRIVCLGSDKSKEKVDVNQLLINKKKKIIHNAIDSAYLYTDSTDFKKRKNEDIELAQKTVNTICYRQNSKIDRVRNIGISEVLTSLIKLELRNEYTNKIRCVFKNHNDKTASFVFNDNRYRCFGCNRGGDTIDFVKEYYNISFIEAIEMLEGVLNNEK